MRSVRDPAGLGKVPKSIECFDDALKGKAVEGQVYVRSCSACKKGISFIGNDVPKICPHCGKRYIFKPRDERRLFILQDDYYDSGCDQAILGEMYLEMKRYAANMIKNQAKVKRGFSKEYIEDTSNEAALRLVERYLKTPGSRIDFSFGKMLSKKLGSIMNDKKQIQIDQLISLDQPFFENGSKLADNLARMKLGSVEKLYARSMKDVDEGEHVRRSFARGLDAVYLKIRQDYGAKRALLFLCGVRIQLFAKRPESAVDRFYTFFGSKTRSDMEKAELLMREMIKEGALA
jgi:DNA-directed RNA polymerase subunit RPC12/RpoP